MAVLVGQTSAGTAPDFFASGNTAAWPFTASATGTAVSMSCQFKVANAAINTVKLGIYNDVAGAPGTLQTSGAVTPDPTGTGLFTANITAFNIVSGTTYWLAVSGAGEQVDLQGSALAGREGTGNMVATWADLGAMADAPVIYAESVDSVPVARVRPLVLKLALYHPTRFPQLQFAQYPVTSAQVDVTISALSGDLVLSAGTAVPILTTTPSAGNLVLSAGTASTAIAATPPAGNLVLSAGVAAPAVTTTPSVGNLVLGAAAATPVFTLTPTAGNIVLSAGTAAPSITTLPSVGALTLSAAAATYILTVAPPAGNLVLGAAAATTVGGTAAQATSSTQDMAPFISNW